MSSHPSEFGRLVRSRRVAVGLTQAELAEVSRLSERTVSDLERGVRTTVYPATARQLATALRIGEDDLAAFLSVARGPMSMRDRLTPIPADQRSRLPVPLTRLIGRETELSMVLNMVRDPTSRLVTLVGPGGIGKTRLAIEVATISLGDFAAGSFFVNLSATDDPEMVLPLVATAIGLQPGTGMLIPALAERAGKDRTLVVLDTFEHLVAAAPAVAELLAACAGLTVLVTSRAPLHVRGECEVPLLSLAVRGPGLRGAAPPPAVELFLERAVAVAPRIDVSVASIAVASEICARVDGLPLAIELAAARVKHMPLAELLVQLDHRLDPLVGGARDLPLRQQTMRGALDWSYQLLGDSEMRLFRCLSVFRGGFGREAAEAVAAADGAVATPNTLSTLSALIDSSLVLVETSASRRARYRLLDVIREFAVEKAAAADELEPLRRRHADHFLAVAEGAEPKLRGAEQRHWYAQLVEDEGNFRAALSWAFEAGQSETALRLAGALWMFWRWAGLFAEGRDWLDAALAAGEGCSLQTRCQGLWGAGWLAYHHGDYRRTNHVGRHMLQLLGAGGDPQQRRNALTLVGNAALAQGRGDDAIAALSDGLALCEGLGTNWHLATSCLNLGIALMQAGRTGEGQALFERALAIYEEIGDQHFAARSRIRLGYARLVMGEPRAAAALVRRAMEMVAELGDSWGVAEGLEAVATLHCENTPRSAALLAGAAEQLRERISMRPHPADAIINGAYLDRARERLTSEAYAEAWAEGRGMTPEAAVSIALQGDAVAGTDIH